MADNFNTNVPGPLEMRLQTPPMEGPMEALQRYRESQLAQQQVQASVEIARVPVAIGLRGDAPNLDVSTPAAMRKTMLTAKSVKYAPTGAALLTVQRVLATLGIADSIKDSSKITGTVPLGPGEYEINLYPLSEILPNKALRNLGPVTAELQVPAIITAVIGKNAADVNSAKALTKFLQGGHRSQAHRCKPQRRAAASRASRRPAPPYPITVWRRRTERPHHNYCHLPILQAMIAPMRPDERGWVWSIRHQWHIVRPFN